MIDVKYTKTVQSWVKDGNTIEIKTNNAAVFYGIFKNGVKQTEFMNSRECWAAREIQKFLSERNMNRHGGLTY